MILIHNFTELLNKESQFLLIDVPNSEDVENPYSPLTLSYHEFNQEQINKGENSPKYAFILRTSLSMKQLGIGDNTSLELVDWELIEEGIWDDQRILIFEGHGNNITGRLFNGKRIACNKNQVYDLIKLLIEVYPDYFTKEILVSTLCLEDINSYTD